MVLVCARHEPPGPNSRPFEDTLLAGSAAILCTGGLDVIRKEAWSFYRAISGVRLCWELEEPKGRRLGEQPAKSPTLPGVLRRSTAGWIRARRGRLEGWDGRKEGYRGRILFRPSMSFSETLESWQFASS